MYEGNVTVKHGNNNVKAKSLIFNRKTNEISFSKIEEFQVYKGIKLLVNEASISGDLSQGIITAAKLVLDQSIKIQSDEIRLKMVKFPVQLVFRR